MNRLKEIRNSLGLSQTDVAVQLGITQQAYANYERGVREADYGTLKKISEIFNTSIDYILSNNTLPISKGIKIPVLGKVQAGIPMEAVEYIIDWEEIPPEMASNGDYFGLVVKGNSMEPRFIEGDVVIVRKQTSAETGDIVIALVNGDEATIKKLKILNNGIMLIPFNPSYDTMFYDKDDIENKPVNIIGKVVELRGKF